MSQLTFDFTAAAVDPQRLAKPRSRVSLAAEADFRARLKELGATLLEPEWRGSATRHRVLDAAGHECWPTPSNVRSGWGFCKTCAGQDPAVTEAKFRTRLKELGATLVETCYLGSDVPHHVICVKGHNTYPRPHNAIAGHGICEACAGKSSAVAEANFRAKLAELGCTPLFERYRGVHQGHPCLCVNGHACSPSPGSLFRGQGPCLACAERCPVTAAAKFSAAVAELGGAVVGEYKNAYEPVHCVCAAGHDCYPRPHNLRLASGICRICMDRDYTVFYVVEHETKPTVKFGISSQDGRHRLRAHQRAGYTRQHLLVTDLPQGVAEATEDAVKATLALAGCEPVRGYEYFDASCLALILDVAGSWVQPVAV